MRRFGAGTAAAVGAVLAAAVFAVWSALAWTSAATSEGVTTASARDDALRQGGEHVATLTTMDHHDVAGGLRRWLTATAGPLRAELADTDPATLTAAEQAGSVATGTVLQAALSEFQPTHGRATLLASVEIATVRSGAEPVYSRNRYRAHLRHTEHGWKVEKLDTIPVGGTS